MSPPAGGAPRLSRRALLEAGAVAGAAVLLGGCGEQEARPDRAADAAVLAGLPARESAAIAALGAALETLRGGDARAARAMLAEDRRHAERLAAALRARGRRAPSPPASPRVPGAEGLEPALAAKEAALAAYAAAAARLGDGELRAAVLGMAGDEAAHAATLRLLLGADPAPDAFAGLA